MKYTAELPTVAFLQRELWAAGHTLLSFLKDGKELIGDIWPDLAAENQEVLKLIFDENKLAELTLIEVHSVLRFYTRLFEGGITAHELTQTTTNSYLPVGPIEYFPILSSVDSGDYAVPIPQKAKTIIAGYTHMLYVLEQMKNSQQFINIEYSKYLGLFSVYAELLFGKYVAEPSLLEAEILGLESSADKKLNSSELADKLFCAANTAQISKSILKGITDDYVAIHNDFVTAHKDGVRNMVHYYFTFSKDLLALKHFLLRYVSRAAGMDIPAQKPLTNAEVVLKRSPNPVADLELFPNAKILIVNSVNSPQWPHSMLLAMAAKRGIKIVSCADSSYTQLREFIVVAKGLPINSWCKQFAVKNSMLLLEDYATAEEYSDICAVHHKFSYTLPEQELLQNLIFENIVTSLDQYLQEYQAIGLLRLESLLKSEVMAEPVYKELILVLSQAICAVQDFLRIELMDKFSENCLQDQLKALFAIARAFPKKTIDIILPKLQSKKDIYSFVELYERILDGQNNPPNIQFTLFLDEIMDFGFGGTTTTRETILELVQESYGSHGLQVNTLMFGTTNLDRHIKQQYKTLDKYDYSPKTIEVLMYFGNRLREINKHRAPIHVAILGLMASDEAYIRKMIDCFQNIPLHILTNNEYVRTQTYKLLHPDN